jgi:hypothetical protein
MITAHQGTDSITAVRLSRGDEPKRIKLGNYTLTLTYTGRAAHIPPQPAGQRIASPIFPPPTTTEPPLEAAAILISTGPDEYYFAGGGMSIDFAPNTPTGPRNVGLGDVQEGKFVNGKWVVTRQLAGDDDAQGEILLLRPNTILRATLYRFP